MRSAGLSASIRRTISIALCCFFADVLLPAQVQNPPAPGTNAAAAAIYAKARSVIDLSLEELRSDYPEELGELKFDPDQSGLAPLLQKTGEKVAAFFRDFPKTVAKEQVRMELMDNTGRSLNSITREYAYSFSSDRSASYWEEARTESNGSPVDIMKIRGYFLAPGRGGVTVFLHPRHQDASRFRYLGKESSDSGAYVIAFAQKPEAGDYLGSYQSESMIAPTLLLFQGLVWVDPATFQIVRMRTDLLAPRYDVGLLRQTAEIRFSSVTFKSMPDPFWLPSEVVITNATPVHVYRNRHRYSDYMVFSVETIEKFELPRVKKDCAPIASR